MYVMYVMSVKLDRGAFLPERAHKTDAGLDLRTPQRVVIPPNGSVIVDTGVHIQLPPGMYGSIRSKSGLNFHSDLISDGVIDESYRGSIHVKLYNLGKTMRILERGDKITQLIIEPYIAPAIEQANELDETERGSNGFGSTGR